MMVGFTCLFLFFWDRFSHYSLTQSLTQDYSVSVLGIQMWATRPAPNLEFEKHTHRVQKAMEQGRSPHLAASAPGCLPLSCSATLLSLLWQTLIEFDLIPLKVTNISHCFGNQNPLNNLWRPLWPLGKLSLGSQWRSWWLDDFYLVTDPFLLAIASLHGSVMKEEASDFPWGRALATVFLSDIARVILSSVPSA